MPPCLLLLAAGAARRMRGADKLLEPVGGAPVLRVLAERGLAAGLSVRVAVPRLDHPRARALAGLPVRLVAVRDCPSGMAASLGAGIVGLDAPSVLILPADMPEITTADLLQVARHPGEIVQATSEDGIPGHPVRFDEKYFAELQALSGDVGARRILESHADSVVRIALPAQHALCDLDTPEDWAQWRMRQDTSPQR